MDLYHILRDVSFSGIILILSHVHNLFHEVHLLSDLSLPQVWITTIRVGLLNSTSHKDFYWAIRLLLHNKTLSFIFDSMHLFASQSLSQAVKGTPVKMIMHFSCF